jgi:hypothetical protein
MIMDTPRHYVYDNGYSETSGWTSRDDLGKDSDGCEE